MFHPFRFIKRIIYAALLIGLAFVIINYKGLLKQAEFYFYQKYPKAEVVRLILEDKEEKEEIPKGTWLVVPKIKVDAPVVEVASNDEKVIQKGLEDGVVHYPGTAGPGEKGNYFILGHSSDYIWRSGNYKDVFALLNKLEEGDQIKIYNQSKEYKYKVFDKIIVSPESVEVLKSTSDPIISLMTCWPIGTPLKRLIVKARLVDNLK